MSMFRDRYESGQMKFKVFHTTFILIVSAIPVLKKAVDVNSGHRRIALLNPGVQNLCLGEKIVNYV